MKEPTHTHTHTHTPTHTHTHPNTQTHTQTHTHTHTHTHKPPHCHHTHDTPHTPTPHHTHKPQHTHTHTHTHTHWHSVVSLVKSVSCRPSALVTFPLLSLNKEPRIIPEDFMRSKLFVCLSPEKGLCIYVSPRNLWSNQIHNLASL